MTEPTNKPTRETRNLGVVIISSLLALILGSFAYTIIATSREQIVYGIMVALLAIMCLVVAIYGRKSIFKVFIELFTWL